MIIISLVIWNIWQEFNKYLTSGWKSPGDKLMFPSVTNCDWEARVSSASRPFSQGFRRLLHILSFLPIPNILISNQVQKHTCTDALPISEVPHRGLPRETAQFVLP